MTDQQTIDIADAEIPVPGPVVAAVRRILGRLPYDEVGDLPAKIDAALQRWVRERRTEGED